MENVKILRIVVASPSDVSAERALLDDKVIKKLNRGVAAERGLRLELSRWETDSHPGFHLDGPQGLIDPILNITACDLLIGIFWKRFGTPTADGQTGTEHEFKLAYEAWKEKGSPQILVYFNQKAHAPQSSAEAEQWTKVLKFREAFPKEGLWWSYNGPDEFEELVRDHLENYLRNRDNVSHPPPAASVLLQGWIAIDRNFLEVEAQKYSADRAVGFFDGRAPSWGVVCSEQISRRKIVAEIVECFQKARKSDDIKVRAVLGAGGEGKSTILMQAAEGLIGSGQPWEILWRDDPEKPLATDSILTREEKTPLLIVADNADLRLDDFHQAVRRLAQRGARNVHFLLASSDAGWNVAGGENRDWAEYCDYDEDQFRIERLKLEEAEQIVAAWNLFGKEGLAALGEGKSDGLTPDEIKEAAARLIKAAELDEKNYPGESSLLGAMLDLRYRKDGLKSRVRKIIEKLKKTPAPVGNLANAFARIAALHAEDKPITSRSVLAHSLKCSREQLQNEVIALLGNEAVGGQGGIYILTRHRKIAEVAVEVLGQGSCEEVIRIMLRSALQLFNTNRQSVAGIQEWNKLPAHIFGRGRKKLAIELAEICCDEEPQDPIPLTELCRLLGKISSENAVAAFRKRAERVRRDRGVFQEWGVCEGKAGNLHNDVWLTAIALADSQKMEKLDNARVVMCLNSLAQVFLKLSGDGRKTSEYLWGCVGATLLGFKVAWNERTDETLPALEHIKEDLRDKGKYSEVSDELSWRRIESAIKQAGRQAEDGVPDWVPQADELEFERAKKLIELANLKAEEPMPATEQSTPSKVRIIPLTFPPKNAG